MTDRLKVALAQLNPKVGDVAGNLAKVRAARAEAKKQGDMTRARQLFDEQFQKASGDYLEAIRTVVQLQREGVDVRDIAQPPDETPGVALIVVGAEDAENQIVTVAGSNGTLPLEQAAEAHRYLEGGRSRGKILLQI